MTTAEWNDLERLWQSLPAQAAPVVEELKRQQKWRWFSNVVVSSEIAIGVAGAAAGVWMLTRGDLPSVVIGVATLAFVAIVLAASIWARSIGRARAEDSVMLAVETAVRHARLGVRLAVATLWSVCASLVFLAVVAFVINVEADPGKQGSGYVAIGIALIWLAGWFGGTIFYLRKRTADLARLQALKASLAQEV